MVQVLAWVRAGVGDATDPFSNLLVLESCDSTAMGNIADATIADLIFAFVVSIVNRFQ